MPLLPLPVLLDHARRHRYAVGYFESWDAYSFAGVLDAAIEARSPVIVGFGATMVDAHWLDHGGITLLGATGRALLADCPVPVAFLLNETHSREQALTGIAAGFTAVMMDTHRWPPRDLPGAVAALVRDAHPVGVAVEAEIGSLPDYVGGRIDHTGAELTTPGSAQEFVAATGVDCLAVSVGNVHLLTEGQAHIDLDLLRQIGAAVPVPLAIHGGTGFPPAAVGAAIDAGVAKFNVGTVLKRAALTALSDALARCSGQESVHDLVGSHSAADLLSPGRQAVRAAVRERMDLYRSAGQADAVLREASA